METIFERLGELLNSNNNSYPKLYLIKGPESNQAITNLETKINNKLPDDYRDYLLKFGESSIEGEESSINFFLIDDMLNDRHFNLSEMGNVLPFASDGGGGYYFFDLENKGENGANSIFYIDTGARNWKYVIFMTNTLRELIRKTLDNDWN